MRLGLISDTHGLLRPEAVAALAGCEHIIHGGDIGSEAILQQLAALAPLSVVRGNNDTAPWAQALPETLLLQLGAIQVYVIHDLAQADLASQAVGAAVVVSGHSHQPSIREQGGTLYINPGSAGPRRFKLPIAVGELLIENQRVSARIIELPAGVQRPATRSRRAAS